VRPVLVYVHVDCVLSRSLIANQSVDISIHPSIDLFLFLSSTHILDASIHPTSEAVCILRLTSIRACVQLISLVNLFIYTLIPAHIH
jgi:hypothetical protein